MTDLNMLLLVLSLSVLVPALMSCTLLAPAMVPEITEQPTSYPLRAALMLLVADCYCEALLAWGACQVEACYQVNKVLFIVRAIPNAYIDYSVMNGR